MTKPAIPAEQDSGVDDEPQPTMLEQMGGISGLIYSSVPVLVFVLANALFGLQVGIFSALGSAVLIFLWRLVRKQPLTPAISGFFGVAIAAFIANQVGSAKGFFFFGIWASAAYGAVFLISILVRWPMAGVIWSSLNGHGQGWRKDPESRRDYSIATFAFVLVFAARALVQGWLAGQDLIGWLAFAKLAMGYPLTGLALIVTVWAVRRADRRRVVVEEAEQAKVEDEEARLRAKYGEPAPGRPVQGPVEAG